MNEIIGKGIVVIDDGDVGHNTELEVKNTKLGFANDILLMYI